MLLHQFMNGALEVMPPTSLQKDTTFTKIFVGGLPYHTNDASLRKYFEAFGEIDEAVVITDRQTGKSRGYGFVSTHTRVTLKRYWFTVYHNIKATNIAYVSIPLSPKV